MCTWRHLVLRAGREALVLLAVGADVDRQHAEVVVGHAGAGQVAVGPGAVLQEHGLAGGELGRCVLHGLAGERRRGDRLL